LYAGESRKTESKKKKEEGRKKCRFPRIWQRRRQLNRHRFRGYRYSAALAERLREKILTGELREGEQLRQDAIGNEFQISRIPVREALSHLAAEGLITIYANRGAVVSALSPDEIMQFFETRAVLECYMLRCFHGRNAPSSAGAPRASRCKTRNPELASAALWKHITEAGEYLREFIKSRRERHTEDVGMQERVDKRNGARSPG